MKTLDIDFDELHIERVLACNGVQSQTVFNSMSLSTDR
jgi:hypothetical protein